MFLPRFDSRAAPCDRLRRVALFATDVADFAPPRPAARPEPLLRCLTFVTRSPTISYRR